ncbi:MAG: hypothetical protein N839_0001275 [Desulfofustis sp. PB-SRB1]|jgi:hypothetical protein|nr:hypothetical protein [Desulfofustis sp. PB-SRB1]MBM1001021.1 hypothetical protein [Desulfofustis sp. PB-SRB1]
MTDCVGTTSRSGSSFHGASPLRADGTAKKGCMCSAVFLRNLHDSLSLVPMHVKQQIDIIIISAKLQTTSFSLDKVAWSTVKECGNIVLFYP